VDPDLGSCVQGACGLWWAALALACEVASAPQTPDLVASEAAPEACAPAEAVDFTWSIEPVPEDISLAVTCVLGEVVAGAGMALVPLECAEAEGPRGRRLWVQATPAPPTRALRAGLSVRLWAIAASDEAGGEGSFVRLETASGGLLIAGARGGMLLAPDGSDPWVPFVMMPGTSTCMSEETACGAVERSAIDLRRAGGPPRILHDASWAAVGDLGEAQVWVSAAIVGDSACIGPSGAHYEVGMMAAR